MKLYHVCMYIHGIFKKMGEIKKKNKQIVAVQIL